MRTNESKHTPGPWHLGVRQAERIVYDANGWAVANATVYHGKDQDGEAKANAQRIVACVNALEGFANPDAARMLLEAARAALVLMERLSEVDQRIIATPNHPTESECNLSHYANYHRATLRAAIAAATGSDADAS